MKKVLFLLPGLLLGDTWNCVNVVNSSGPYPSYLPANPTCVSGGSFTQNATFNPSAYSSQVQATVWSTTVNANGTGVCVGVGMYKPSFVPMTQAGPSTPSGYASGQSWYVAVTSYTLEGQSPNYTEKASTAPQGIQDGIPGMCFCYQKDCQNPAVNGQCTATCNPQSCSGSPGFACSSGSTPVCNNGLWSGCTNGGTQCSLPPPTNGCVNFPGTQLVCGGGTNEIGGGWSCYNPLNGSPIVIDTEDQGFHLTDWRHGVRFAFYPNQPPVQLSWTDASYANGWLALDRNGNGVIDNATELFGNITPQPATAAPNGFLALAVFDDPANGGNGNGVIDPGDAVYPHLRVWIDANHDGISQSRELKNLAELGIFRLDLKYIFTPYGDQYGNQFRYHGTLWDAAERSHQATYDVFLTAEPKRK